MFRLFKKSIMLSLILSGIGGCKTVSTGTASDYCLIAKPIGYSIKNDSPETVAAVRKYDSEWVCICEHDCPK